MGSEEPSELYKLRSREIYSKRRSKRKSSIFNLFQLTEDTSESEEADDSSDSKSIIKLDSSDSDINEISDTFNSILESSRKIELQLPNSNLSINSENSQSVNMARNKFNMKECNSFIPDFGIDPKISLDNFITRVEMIQNDLEENEKIKFFNFILCKLNGDAYDAYRFNSANIDDWDALKKQLKLKFKPIKSLNNLKTDLFQCVQENNESISMFADRIQKLLSELNNSYIDRLGRADSVFIIQDNNSTALNSFSRGLKNLSIKTLVLAGNYKTLMEAVTKALEEESCLNLNAPSTSKSSVSHTKDSTKISNSNIVCQICNKSGHIASKCFKRFDRVPRQSNNFSPRFSNRSVNQVSIECQYCHKKGHKIEFCFKRIAAEGRRSSLHDNPALNNNEKISENCQGSENKKGTPYRISN